MATGKEFVNGERLRIGWDRGRPLPKLEPLDGRVLTPKIDGFAGL